ncbi:MAG: HAMP domain-containing histidine kinase [Bacteriovoracaceae bacterium]|nr:HAMP domain-containing histidine kinase [Bacteriovoracaceae bacterium]
MENQSNPRTQKAKVIDNFSTKSGEHHSSFSKKNRHALDKFQHRSLPNHSIESVFKKSKSIKDTIREKTPWIFIEKQKEDLFKVSNFTEFTDYILNLEDFSRYDSCQILIHKKGNPYFLSFSHLAKQLHGNVLFDLKSFNQIFNSVKKSKTKIFNQTSLESPHLESVGHFMAKEIEFKNFNVLFFLSMNSFIPNTKEDIEEFGVIIDFLSPYIQLLCEDISQKEHYKISKHLFHYFPFGLEITNNDKIVFKNQFFDQFNKDECQKYSYSELAPFTVHIYIPSKFGTASEVHHFQRVALLGELLNTLQHELSNPLFGIKLASDLLKLDAPDEDTASLLEDVCKSAERSQGIITTFSSLYHDNDNIRSVNLAKLIEEAITLTKSESKQIRKITNNQIGDDVYVDINASYLTQIIFNLIINSAQAIKLSREDYRNDQITITIEKSDDTHVLLAISDTGPGIKGESLEKIFTPFFTTKSTGTGLGLSICQSLANKMNTQINFKNNDHGPGVTFTLMLPWTKHEHKTHSPN